MKLNQRQAATVRGAVQHWQAAGLLTEPQSTALLADIEAAPFDWRKLAKYSFWLAIVCLVTAVSAVVMDQALMELLQKIFDAPYAAKCAALAGVATGLYGWGIQRRKRAPEKVYSNEALLFLGVLATAGAIYQFGRAVDTGSGHFSLLLLLACLVYAALGFFFRSPLIWLFALLSLGSWFGTETGYASGWGAYYLGMNYPLRFVLFGAVLTAAAFAMEKPARFQPFHLVTLVMGLLYLFIALWILSIFGNYGDESAWRQVRQIELLHWSLLFALAGIAAVVHGLKFENAVTKGFGLTFLFINLYTRYFEYFWNPVHKAIFFAVLGLSFWFVGTRAERIWNLGKRKPPAAP